MSVPKAFILVVLFATALCAHGDTGIFRSHILCMKSVNITAFGNSTTSACNGTTDIEVTESDTLVDSVRKDIIGELLALGKEIIEYNKGIFNDKSYEEEMHNYTEFVENLKNSQVTSVDVLL